MKSLATALEDEQDNDREEVLTLALFSTGEKLMQILSDQEHKITNLTRYYMIQQNLLEKNSRRSICCIRVPSTKYKTATNRVTFEETLYFCMKM
ncbi:hypothetical protein NPIL_363461 [Nephila pilipes]|uniref:Uncharacterized protein n=1 Tax=Nephila pilipes TaxID=299642 RepID=A0A8X6NI40_NEPPI|nr:hypothetical protein NPIL_363461 [Nephila pilipes]